MTIELKKFGSTLTSRQFGKEAFAAFSPTLNEVAKDELVEVVFDEVETFSPSWGDEFLTPLLKKYGERLKLKKSENLSVIETLKTLEEVNKSKFNIID
jgi:hypothetical protein